MLGMVSATAVAIGTSMALSLIVKATVVSAGALIAAHVARRWRAAIRCLLMATAFVMLLALPLVSIALPSREVVVSLHQQRSVTDDASVDALATSSRFFAGDASRSQMVTAARQQISGMLLAAWISGVAVILVPMIAGLTRLRRVRENGLPWHEGQRVMADVARSLALRRSIQLLLDDTVVGPMTFGTIRPVVVLPRDAWAWSQENLRRAIVHELEHIRRWDWLTLYIARCVCALYWFHPLVWMSWRRLRLEAERACDDVVLQLGQPESYADQLVTLALRLAFSQRHSGLAMASRGDLSARISAVLDDRQARGQAGTLSIAVMAVGAVLLLVGVAPLRAVPFDQGAPEMRLQFEPVTSTTPRFDVVSIKRNLSGDDAAVSRGLPGGSFQATNFPLRRLVLNAYRLQNAQLVGAPEWINDERYDIQARSATNVNGDTFMPMLRALLADRFNLRLRVETREAPVYRLVIVRADRRLGPGLKLTTADECATSSDALPTPDAPLRCGAIQFGPGRLMARGATMGQLAALLMNRGPTTGIDRIVIDRTGLPEYYAFDLRFAPAPGSGPATAVADPSIDDGPAFFTALREEFGLRLEPRQAPVEVAVVDAIERPTDN